MSRAARRLLARSPFTAAIESFSTRPNLKCFQTRTLSETSRRSGDEKDPLHISPSPTASGTVATSIPNGPLYKSVQERQKSTIADLASFIEDNKAQRANPDLFLDISRMSSIGGSSLLQQDQAEEPHHFHIYATRHNTHITVTKPNRDPIISVSAGNIGFRKAARKHYDTAFQLAGYVMAKMQERGLNAEIQSLEVTLRGFGAGREAVTKALLGNEGKFLRGKVVKVSDATRLKFGGTRSKKPRRLG